MQNKHARMALTAVVLVHLAVMSAHGAAHAQAGVALGPAGNAFVLLVIGIGPVAGLLWSFANLRAGALVVAMTMAASLVFGAVNHFLVPGPDHVAHVAGAAKTSFGVTAALLVVSELAGAAVGWVSTARASRVNVPTSDIERNA